MSKVTIVILAIVIGVFTTGLTIVLAVVLWPRGEKIGETKILPASPPVNADLMAGDELAFRLDYVVNGGPMPGRARRKTVLNNYLAATKLTVTAKHESGASQTAVCDIDGHSTMTTSSPGQEDRSGVGVDCKIVVAKAGKHTIQGTIAWDSNLEPVSATLEVRRSRK